MTKPTQGRISNALRWVPALWLLLAGISGIRARLAEAPPARVLSRLLEEGAEARIEGFLQDWGSKAGWDPRWEGRARRMLLRHTGEGARIFLLGEDPWKRQALLDHMAVLLYPRRFWPLAGLPPDWRSRVTAIEEPVFFLELFPDATVPGIETACVKVAEEPGLRLWLVPRSLRSGGGK